MRCAERRAERCRASCAFVERPSLCRESVVHRAERCVERRAERRCALCALDLDVFMTVIAARGGSDDALSAGKCDQPRRTSPMQ